MLADVFTGRPVEIRRHVILIAGLLRHVGWNGPAEIPAKRAWTCRWCTWRARRHAVRFRMTAVHPLDPIRYLRLAHALDSGAMVVRAIFDAVDRRGGPGGLSPPDGSGRTSGRRRRWPDRDERRSAGFAAPCRAGLQLWPPVKCDAIDMLQGLVVLRIKEHSVEPLSRKARLSPWPRGLCSVSFIRRGSRDMGHVSEQRRTRISGTETVAIGCRATGPGGRCR